MKTVNSLSGGKTSSYLAMHYPADYNVFSIVCIDDIPSKPKDNAIIRYAQNKLDSFTKEFGEFIATAEDDKTLRVMMDLEQLLGSEIIWVRGQSFDDIIDKGTHTRLPSWARRYCTEKMKLLPIFLWWWREIGEKIKMNIGFRFDEFGRMERFFNNSNPTSFRIPIQCKTYGQKMQVWQEYDWRFCSFPLIRDVIDKQDIDTYWKHGGYIQDKLFSPHRKIEFPAVSNCIGCFHKNKEVLAAMAELNQDKFRWFAQQELKGMGTWLDDKVTYQHIMENRKELFGERVFEIEMTGSTCDSGGCTA